MDQKRRKLLGDSCQKLYFFRSQFTCIHLCKMGVCPRNASLHTFSTTGCSIILLEGQSRHFYHE